LVAAAEIRVLASDRVEAVRAGGDDLRHAGLVQRGHVLPRLLLKRVLVAHPPGRVAGARLAAAQDGEVDAGLLEQLRGGDRRLPGPFIERRRAADPEQDLGRLLARLQDADVQTLRPLRAVALWLAPRVGPAVDVAQHRRRLVRESRLDHYEVAAQVDDVVDVLDADRALAHARAARDAVPHHVVGDRVRHQ